MFGQGAEGCHNAYSQCGCARDCRRTHLSTVSHSTISPSSMWVSEGRGWGMVLRTANNNCWWQWQLATCNSPEDADLLAHVFSPTNCVYIPADRRFVVAMFATPPAASSTSGISYFLGASVLPQPDTQHKRETYTEALLPKEKCATRDLALPVPVMPALLE